MLIVILGLVFVGLGIGLGAVDGDTLGGMDGLVLGVATIFVGAFVLKDF